MAQEAELAREQYRSALLRERAQMAERERDLLLGQVQGLREAVVLRSPEGVACRVCGKLSKDGFVHAKWCTIAALSQEARPPEP